MEPDNEIVENTPDPHCAWCHGSGFVSSSIDIRQGDCPCKWEPHPTTPSPKRIQGACEAMARFLVWVWIQARYQQLDADVGGFQWFDGYTPIGEAIERGLLRLDWGGRR